MEKIPSITPEVCGKVPDPLKDVCKQCMQVKTYTVEKNIEEYNIDSGKYEGESAKKACMLAAAQNGQMPSSQPSAAASAPPKKVDAHLQQLNIV